MKKLFQTETFHADLSALLLRLTFGGVFVYYGFMKLSNYESMLGMFGDPIGLGSELSLILVIFAEFFCAIFVVVGLLTRLSVIPIFITMVVAFFIAHAKDPFHVKSLAFVFLCLSVVIFIQGSGRYSVDALFVKK
jgi:putative oxidoreductase